LNGASGGLLIAWVGNLFDGVTIEMHRFATTVKLTSLHSGQEWFLSNIYGPCAETDKTNFINWLYNYDASGFDLWMMVGDFNLMRSVDNHNRPVDNLNDMMLFNDVIHHLDLVEIPLKGRAFTWSNMQQNCLLETIGCSAALIGLWHSRTHWLLFLVMWFWIMCPMLSLWNLLFLKPPFLGLRIIGQVFWIFSLPWNIFGHCPFTGMTQCSSYLPNSRCSVEG
jgi:hypothetical protein